MSAEPRVTAPVATTATPPAADLRPRARWRPPSPADGEALALWALTRLATFVLAGAGAWLLASPQSHSVSDAVGRWQQWDAVHLREIAQYGYGGDPTFGPQVPLQAFFPGFPAVLRGVHALGGGWVLGGLLISLVASAVAAVALSRLGELSGPAGTGPRAVLLLFAAPSAVFLAAGYTEALFLALALPAWLAARRGRWPLAALLVAGAATVRVTGIFLAAALVVEFLTSPHRRMRAAPWLLAPAVPIVAYMSYLRASTGDWMAWIHAQQREWHRSLTDPITSFRTTWNGAVSHDFVTGWVWSFRAEIVAVLVGVVVCAWLLWRRRWSELTYVGLQVLALGTSSFYFSVPRATLLWWPMWIGLAQWSMRRRAVVMTYLAVALPIMAVLTVTFTEGRWAG